MPDAVEELLREREKMKEAAVQHVWSVTLEEISRQATEDILYITDMAHVGRDSPWRNINVFKDTSQEDFQKHVRELMNVVTIEAMKSVHREPVQRPGGQSPEQLLWDMHPFYRLNSAGDLFAIPDLRDRFAPAIASYRETIRLRRTAVREQLLAWSASMPSADDPAVRVAVTELLEEVNAHGPVYPVENLMICVSSPARALEQLSVWREILNVPQTEDVREWLRAREMIMERYPQRPAMLPIDLYRQDFIDDMRQVLSERQARLLQATQDTQDREQGIQSWMERAAAAERDLESGMTGTREMHAEYEHEPGNREAGVQYVDIRFLNAATGAIGLSAEMLHDEERTLLRELSVHPDGHDNLLHESPLYFEGEAARAVRDAICMLNKAARIKSVGILIEQLAYGLWQEMKRLDRLPAAEQSAALSGSFRSLLLHAQEKLAGIIEKEMERRERNR